VMINSIASIRRTQRTLAQSLRDDEDEILICDEAEYEPFKQDLQTIRP